MRHSRSTARSSRNESSCRSKISSFGASIDIAIFRDQHQVVVSSSDPVCPVGYINFTKLHLVPKAPSDFKEYVIKNSLDFINELNSSSYSDLSDPDLTDTELEFIEKENSAKQTGPPGSHRNSFSRSQSMTMTKNNSLEQPDAPEEMKFEYEQVALQNEAHVVSNSKGWHWISSIQGECSVKRIIRNIHG